MLCIKTKKGYLPLENRDNFSIVYSYEGEQTLSFDLASNDPYFPYIKEGVKVKYKDNRYYITKINKRKSIVTVCAELDLNEWKTTIHRTFDMHDVLFIDVLLRMKPEDWTIEQAGIVKERFDISLEGVSDYDILMACRELYGIVFEYHIEEKRIKVIDPSVIQQRGLYLSEELNLDSVEYKGEYNVMVNRLYAYGKKTTIKESDGTTHEEYVTFASINHGLEYVDCMEYTPDEIICAYFHDDKVVDAQELLTLAKERVKELAFPTQSWGCNIYDLSRTNEKYKHLDFKLYDKPVLLADGMKILHQIVEYTAYPDQQHLNKVVLSTSFKKIQGEISTIKSDVSKIDTDLKGKESLLNELEREVNSNSLRIGNTYTKKEVDIKQESILQQSNDYIDVSISQIDKKIEVLDLKTIQLQLLKTGTVLNHEVPSITLSAQILKNAQDITADFMDINFTWQRKSNDNLADELWNSKHQGVKFITITTEDLNGATSSFQVTLTTSAYMKYSGYETITLQSNLKVRLDANLPLYQHSIDGVLNPSWNPLRITPEVMDGALQVPLEECEIAWRRSDGELQSGEAVDHGILNVTQNKLSEVSTRVITYICTVKSKHYITLDSLSFTHIMDGVQGSTGNGVSSIIAEYYLSTSKTTQTDGSWMITAPTWTTGKYIWTRSKIMYTDETISYTTAICDSSWEVVNDLEEKINEKINTDINCAEQRISETYESALSLTKEEINASVSKLEESVGKTSETIKGVQNQLELTSEQTSFIKTTIEKMNDIVDGKVDETTIREWARFDGASLALGSSKSPFKAILSNTELAFWQGNTKVAWISNNELHIAHAVVMETLRIGSFQMQHIKGTGFVLNRWE